MRGKYTPNYGIVKIKPGEFGGKNGWQLRESQNLYGVRRRGRRFYGRYAAIELGFILDFSTTRRFSTTPRKPASMDPTTP
jgi:hypothetical protein